MVVGWLGLTVLYDSISVCFVPSSRERGKEKRNDWQVKLGQNNSHSHLLQAL